MSAEANKNVNKINKSNPAPLASGGKDDGGPLSMLNDKIGAGAALAFPSNIEAVDHYMIFSAYKEHAFQGSTVNAQRTNFQKEGSVFLPMPSNLQTNYTQTYNEQAVGALGMEVGGVLGNSIKDAAAGSSSLKEGVSQAFSNMGDRAMKSLKGGGVGGAAMNIALGEGTQLAAAAVGSPIAAAAINKAVQVGTAFAGIARNPHMAVLYESPQFRAFEFGFDFRPKNYQESLAIGQIIHFFKYYSSPEYALGNHFFIYPNQFKIRFKYPEFLYRFGDCVLKNVSVDYHGEGTPIYYDAGQGEAVDLGDGAGSQSGRKLKAPANVKLQLSFQEVKILTKKEINDQGR